MSAMETLNELIDAQQGRLAEGIPPDREPALLALLRHVDRLESDPDRLVHDLITGRARPALGLTLAIRLVLEREDEPPSLATDVDGWAAGFLAACRDLESAAIVRRLVAAGAMRLDAPRAGLPCRVARRREDPGALARARCLSMTGPGS